MPISHIKCNLFLIIIGLIIIFFIVLSNSNNAHALIGTDFQAGRIIDDAIFTNKNSITPAQIQTFLESKVANGSCDTNGTRLYSNGQTRAVYSTSKGETAVFVCLTNYRENPTTKISNFGDPNRVIDGAKSAAQIIWEAGQQYNINPQVLIVLLQKEQGLVTDDWPWAIQFAKATGAYCPDTAACDATKAGFSTQVFESARLFRAYMTTPWLYFLGNNNILWNVASTGCGSGVVNIQNLATVALYHYTPYQPNAASLNNLYGTGDGCSAYGNRNFWRYFNDWFGNTLNPEYAASFLSIQNFTDSTKTQSYPAHQLTSGQRTYMVLKFTNTGNSVWNNSGQGVVRLTIFGKSVSEFCDTVWITCVKPTQLVEASVSPGNIGTFEFWYKAPNVSTTTSFQNIFGVTSDYLAVMGGVRHVQTTTVFPVSPRADILSIQNFTDSTKTQSYPAHQLTSGQRTYMVLKFTNTGNSVWNNSGQGVVRLTIFGKSVSEFCDTVWITCVKPTQLVEASVSPGNIGTFEFWYKAPNVSTTTSFQNIFGVTSDYLAVMGGVRHVQTTTVFPVSPRADILSIQNFTDSTKTQSYPAHQLTSGQRTYMVLKFTNTGNSVWNNSGQGVVRLTIFGKSVSEFCDTVWITCVKPTQLVEASVSPGNIGTFEFWYKAPNVSTTTSFQNIFGVTSDYLAVMGGVRHVQTTTVSKP